MGQRQSRNHGLPTFNPDCWHQIDNVSSLDRPQQGSYRLYCNNLTGEQVQQYQLAYHNEAQLQKYMQLFRWRQRQDNIVNTKYLNTHKTTQFCNVNHTAKTYIQHIPIRLCDIKDIPYPQNLYVLHNTLDGFHKLYHIVGYFAIQENMICIDNDGKIKVWLHSDLSQCHPIGSHFSDQIGNYRKNKQLQTQMVHSIIMIVQNNTTDDIDADMSFQQFLNSSHLLHHIGFSQAKQQLVKYAQTYHADIPQYFQSVIAIIDGHKTDPSPNLSRQNTPFRMHGRLGHDEEGDVTSQPSFNPDQSEVRLVEYDERDTRRLREVEGKGTNRRVLSHVPHAVQYAQSGITSPTPQRVYRPFGEVQSVPPEQTRFSSTVYHSLSPVVSPLNPMTVSMPGGPLIKFNYQGQNGVSVQPQPHAPQTTPTVIHFQQLHQENQNHHQQIHMKEDQYNEFEYELGSKSVPQQQEVRLQHFQGQQEELNFGEGMQQQTSSPPLPEEEEQYDLNKNNSLKNLMHNDRIVYSDSTDTYQLDPQLAEDMIKYFIN